MPYIGKTTDGFGVRNRFVYLASSGDTSVSGADANGATLTFTDGAYVDVYLNGVLLKPTTDYNTSTANTIAGLSALNTNDEVTVVVYDVFTVADMVSATSGGTFSGAVTFNGAFTSLGIDDNADANAITIDSSERILIGTTAAETLAPSTTPKVQIEGTDHHTSSLSIVRNSNDNGQSLLILGKSRGTSVGADTVVQDDDNVGEILFTAADGSDRTPQVASVRAAVDGTPGSNDMPGRLEFYTTADGSQTITKRLQIESNGNIGFGKYPATFSSGNGIHLGDDRYVGFGDGNGTRPDFQLGYTSSDTRLDLRCGFGADTADIIITSSGFLGLGGTLGTAHLFVQEETSSYQCATFKAKGSSYATEAVNVMAERAANSAFSLYKAHSADNADVEFNFRGDGNGFCDGSFSGGGADYAEYFEWKDGNTADENRLGYSVVLDGHQIRKATSSDNASNIIGVISANPTIVGDNDVERWKEKYLKTDFGNYDLDENGDRKLNPDWDKSKTYISREERKEWDTVGLMGKLRVLKGQPTGDRWIKMRDISDTVEEWLVR